MVWTYCHLMVIRLPIGGVGHGGEPRPTHNFAFGGAYFSEV
jgi:hypothetical protein